MDEGKRNVILVSSDESVLHQKEDELDQKDLNEYFYPFTNFSEAVEFVEQVVSSVSKIPYYIVLEDQTLEPRHKYPLDRLYGLSNFNDQLEVIVLTNRSNNQLRKQIMQYPFVSAFLVKPVPDNYIEFLIEGSN